MMRRIPTLLFAALLALSARAQVGEHRSDLAIGVTGGITMNTVSFNPSVAQTMKISPMFGVAVRYNCEKYFTALCGLQMEIDYCNLGWKQNFKDSKTPDYHYKRDMHYIQIPIMARMAWGREHKGLMGFIMAGPQIGFVLGEKEDMSPELALESELLPTSRKAQYGKACEKKFDYGITAGAGMEVNLAKAGHITLDARYTLSLADIFNNTKADYFGRSANSTITIKVTYLFDVLRTKK